MQDLLNTNIWFVFLFYMNLYIWVHTKFLRQKGILSGKHLSVPFLSQKHKWVALYILGNWDNNHINEFKLWDTHEQEINLHHTIQEENDSMLLRSSKG